TIAERGCRGEKDHLSGLLLDHALLCRPGAKKGALEVGVDEGVPVLAVHLEQQVVPDDPRAGHQDVDSAELLDCAFHHLVDLPSIAHVAREGKTVDRPGHPLRRLFVRVGNGAPRPFGGKQTCCRRPDPAPGAGDERDPVLEPHAVSVSSAVPPSLRGSEAPSSLPPPTAATTCG